MVTLMRVLVSFAALLLLAACASSGPAPGPAVASTPNVTGAPSRASQLLAAAGGASAPTRADIEHAFGPADIVRQDGAGAALTYRYDTCALLLLFSTDSRNALRLREAHPSARRAGAAAPTLDQCAAEAAARRA